ncbi:MAG: N-acetylmuramoyl-L-alanine amidase [Planctomycetes bacterium]|nr:N-acetylmuramoyl-L-alanine amidase [Planctomycetota bacterium]MDA0948007.1 peptidoglycan recognition family protein [Planctomycetota bacterium]
MRPASSRRHPGLLALALLASALASSCAARGSVQTEPRPVSSPTAAAPGSAIPSWSRSEASAFDWQTLDAIKAWLASVDASRLGHFRGEARLKLGTGLMGIDPTASESVRADRWERAAEQFSMVLADPDASRDQLDRATELHTIAQRGPKGARSASTTAAADTIAPLPGLVRRGAWAKAPPIASRLNRIDRPFTEFTIHHSDTTHRPGPEGIRRVHVDSERYGDVGYHFLIGPDGTVWEGRSLRYQGAHAGEGRNEGKLGICLLGDFEVARPTPAALRSLEQLVRHLSSELDIPLRAVRGHGEVKATLCPGRHLQRWVDTWRRG